MKDPNLSREVRTVTSPAAIKVLGDLEHQKRLSPLMRGPLSIGELTQRIGEDLGRCHYHVTRYLKLGLVTTVGERKRWGKAVKLYQTTAQTFFVPKTHLVGGDTAGEMDRQYGPLLKRFNQNFAATVRPFEDEYEGDYYYLEASGEMTYHSGPGTEDPATLLNYLKEEHVPVVFIEFRDYQLSREDAKRVQRELIALFERLEQLSSSDQKDKKFTVLLGIAPVKE